MSFLDKIFKKDKRKDGSREREHEMQIGLPTNVVSVLHVSKNQVTGDLEGLPKQWQKMMKTLITEAEQHENPDAGWWHISLSVFSSSLCVSFSLTHSLAFVM
jgi:p21-activated kinase 1